MKCKMRKNYVFKKLLSNCPILAIQIFLNFRSSRIRHCDNFAIQPLLRGTFTDHCYLVLILEVLTTRRKNSGIVNYTAICSVLTKIWTRLNKKLIFFQRIANSCFQIMKVSKNVHYFAVSPLNFFKVCKISSIINDIRLYELMWHKQK